MMTTMISSASATRYSQQQIAHLELDNKRLKDVLEHLALCIKGAADISRKDSKFDLVSALEEISATAMDASGKFTKSSAAA